MAFIRTKTINGRKYYYLVESIREGRKVKQRICQYFGTTLPEGYVMPNRSVVAKAIEKAGTTKVGKVVPSVVPPVSLAPGESDFMATVEAGKKRLAGCQYAYVLRLRGERPSWVRLENWRNVPERGDRVEIIHRHKGECTVSFHGLQLRLGYLYLSPEPPETTVPVLEVSSAPPPPRPGQLQRSGQELSRLLLPCPTTPCPVCGSMIYWFTGWNQWQCSRCHPKPGISNRDWDMVLDVRVSTDDKLTATWPDKGPWIYVLETGVKIIVMTFDDALPPPGLCRG